MPCSEEGKFSVLNNFVYFCTFLLFGALFVAVKTKKLR